LIACTHARSPLPIDAAWPVYPIICNRASLWKRVRLQRNQVCTWPPVAALREERIYAIL